MPNRSNATLPSAYGDITPTPGELEIIAYLEDMNTKSAEWEVQHPGGWASRTPTDLEYVRERGGTTLNAWLLQGAIGDYSDLYKDRHGFRPRHVDFASVTLEEMDKLIEGFRR